MQSAMLYTQLNYYVAPASKENFEDTSSTTLLGYFFRICHRDLRVMPEQVHYYGK